MALSGHLSKLLRYFSGKTGVPPKAAVPKAASDGRVAAEHDIHTVAITVRN